MESISNMREVSQFRFTSVNNSGNDENYHVILLKSDEKLGDKRQYCLSVDMTFPEKQQMRNFHFVAHIYSKIIELQDENDLLIMPYEIVNFLNGLGFHFQLPQTVEIMGKQVKVNDVRTATLAIPNCSFFLDSRLNICNSQDENIKFGCNFEPKYTPKGERLKNVNFDICSLNVYSLKYY